MKFVWKTDPQDPQGNQGIRHDLEREPTRPPLASENGDESERLREQREARKRREVLGQDVHQEKKRERVTEALRKLDEKELARLISSVDLAKNIEAQDELATTAFTVSATHELIGMLLNAGADGESVRNALDQPTVFRQMVEALRQKEPKKFEGWDLTTDSVFQKIVSGKKVDPSWRTAWLSMVATGVPRFEEAKALRDNPPSTWGKVKEIGKDTAKWIYAHKWEIAGALAVGLVARWALKKIFGKKEEAEAASGKTEGKKQESGFGKWAKGLLLAGTGLGALLVLSKIIPLEKIKDWIAGLFGKSEDKEKEEKEDREKKEFYAGIAGKIGIDDPEILMIMGLYPYSDFTSFWGDAKRSLNQKWRNASNFWGYFELPDLKLIPDYLKRYVEKMKSRPEKIKAAEEKLEAFFGKHKELIKESMPSLENVTVHDVLETLARKGVFGKEHQNRPYNSLAVPPATVAAIDRNYLDPALRNDAMTLAERVYKNREKQDKSTNGEQGLIPRLKEMAKKDPSYNKKIQTVEALWADLEQKRAQFHQAVEQKVPLDQLKSRFEDIEKAEEEFKEVAASYYAETQGHFPSWVYLTYFGARYFRLNPRKREIAQEHVRGLVTAPKNAIEAAMEKRDPVGFAKKQLEEAKKDRAEWKGTTDTPRGDLVAKHMESKVKYLAAKVALEEKKAALKNLSPDALRGHEEELLRLEHETVKVHSKFFESAINRVREDLKLLDTEVGSRQKVRLMREVQAERDRLIHHLSTFEKKAIEKAKALGTSMEGQRIAGEAHALLEENRKYVQQHLSLWNDIWSKRPFGKANIDESLRSVFAEWARKEKETGFTKFVKNAKGQAKVMGLLLIPALYGKVSDILEKNPHPKIAELWKELGPGTVQLLFDIAPYTFGVSDWYTLWTAKEVVTGKDVKGWERWSRVLWGTTGALLDVANIVPGVNVAGLPARLALSGVRTAGRAAEFKKLTKMWPKIKDVAERVGGWKKFIQHMKNYKSAAGKAKIGEAVRLAAVPATRIAAVATIGGIALPAIYSLGEDANEPGIDLPQEIVQGMEAEAQAPVAPQTSGTPDAPPEGGDHGSTGSP